MASYHQDIDWSLLELCGKDRDDFITRLTTNALPNLEGQLVHHFFLTVNARVTAECWLARASDRILLLLPKAQKEAAATAIDMYHFTEDLQIERPEGSSVVIFGEVPESLASQALYRFSPDPRYGEDSTWMILAPTTSESGWEQLISGCSPMKEDDLERRRVATGRPRFGLDYDGDTLFLEMAQQGDFSETKGCYPGQEIVARVLHRGSVRRWLRGFHSDRPVPSGWSSHHNGKEVARVTTSAPTADGGSVGYLYVRREVAAAGTELDGGLDGDTSIRLTVRPRAAELESHPEDRP